MARKLSFSVIYTITYLLINSKLLFTTIDINTPELQYLADHLTIEECRKLVAAAHFTNYELTNALSEAELKIPKDSSCFKLLLHWNSLPREGKGQSHEVLEHRLRQLGKYSLADWLGKTVFHQIGADLEESLRDGLKDIDNETTSSESILNFSTASYDDPETWTPTDSIMFAILSFLIITLISIGAIILYRYASKKLNRGQKRKLTKTYQKIQLSDNSSSESEEMFDVRNSNKIF